MNLLVVAGQLWSMFRAVINQALEGIASELGDGKDRVLEVIDEKIAEFFIQSLQLDSFTLEMEFIA